jgi:hypothetical protein
MSSNIVDIYIVNSYILENQQRRKTKGFIIRINHDELVGP